MMRLHNKLPRRVRDPMITLLVLVLKSALLMPGGVALAHDPMLHSAEVFDLVGFDQRLDQTVPEDLTFQDEQGKHVQLRDYLGSKPLVLAMTYFECETLCPLVRGGLADSLQALSFEVGEQFDVVFVSIDPAETPALAAATKAATLAQYGRPTSDVGWHFLTGEHDAIDELADAIGFRYAYDGARDEYAHASGIVILTPGGKIARYFYGFEFAATDLRLGLVEASQHKIGTAIDQLLLLCYHYDPGVGKYSLIIMNVLRAAAVLTVVGLGALIVLMRRREADPAATLGSG